MSEDKEFTIDANDDRKRCPFPVTCCNNNKFFRLEQDNATGYVLVRRSNHQIL